MQREKIDKSFFLRDSITAAEDLLGCFFATNFDHKRVVGKIVETEAYHGEDDLACHASKGRTARTKTLYGEAGKLYIYLNYGIFYLTNIVCGPKNFPSAVLIRSAEIIEGHETAANRLLNHKFAKANEKLASGPGKFSITFGINKDHNQIDITNSKNIYLFHKGAESFDIIKTARIGVDYAKHCKNYLWRFSIKNNRFVSK